MSHSFFVRRLSLLLMVLLFGCLCCVSAQTEEAAEAPTLSISSSELRLMVKKSDKLTATLTGTTARIKWTTSDTKVAIVSSNGTVTARGSGEATITATVTTKDGTVLTADCAVTVWQPVTTVKVSPTRLSLGRGITSEPISFSIQPETSDCQTVIWTSSDESVATVDAEGRVTGVGLGTATITAIADEDREKQRSASVAVTIVQPVEEIRLSADTLRVDVQKSAKLTAEVLPESAAVKTIVWTSSDTSVATVKNGTVVGVSGGTCEIIAAASDGSASHAICTVTVIQPVKALQFASSNAMVSRGKSISLRIITTPEDASDASLTWESSDESIATVDASGTVTGVNTGTATISVTANDGYGAKAKVKVTVGPTNPLKIAAVSCKNNDLYIDFKNVTSGSVIIGCSVVVICYDDNGDVISTGEYDCSIPALLNGKTHRAGKTVTCTVPDLTDSKSFEVGISSVTFKGNSVTLIDEADRVMTRYKTRRK